MIMILEPPIFILLFRLRSSADFMKKKGSRESANRRCEGFRKEDRIEEMSRKHSIMTYIEKETKEPKRCSYTE